MVRQGPRYRRLGVWVVMMVVMAGVRVMMIMKLLSSHIAQVSVLPEQVVHSAVQFIDARSLSLDKTLLVLDDCGKLSQVQNRLHWVFQ